MRVSDCPEFVISLSFVCKICWKVLGPIVPKSSKTEPMLHLFSLEIGLCPKDSGVGSWRRTTRSSGVRVLRAECSPRGSHRPSKGLFIWLHDIWAHLCMICRSKIFVKRYACLLDAIKTLCVYLCLQYLHYVSYCVVCIVLVPDRRTDR